MGARLTTVRHFARRWLPDPASLRAHLGLALFAVAGATIAYFGVQIAWRVATRRARASA